MGVEVEKLIDIVMEEAEKSIQNAFDEGYKQGVLTYKPDIEYWKIQAEALSWELKKTKQKMWLVGIGSAGLGIVGGMGIGFAFRLSY